MPSDESMEDALRIVVRDVRIEMLIWYDHLRLWHRSLIAMRLAVIGIMSVNHTAIFGYLRAEKRTPMM